MDKNKEFLKNTLILFIGKFATQFMSLLLLPLYTHFLIADDFGTVDLLQTYISLFVPIFTLRIDSALFRFLLESRDNKEEQKKIISNAVFILFLSIIFTILFCIIISLVFKIKYFIFVVLNIIVLMISSIMLHILRGFGDNKKYSFVSILTGFFTLLFNIILIVFLKYNASSILISSFLANLICTIYICINLNVFKYFSVQKINKDSVKKIMNYSLPMIPNSLSWWIVNVSDRTIISTFLGVGINAIYTVSCKFSNILNSIFSIISMSWQESASLHIDDDDKDFFFSTTINNIFIVFATISIIIVSTLPFVYNSVIGEQYLESYKYIPILLYSNSWNVLIGLIGGIYVAKKETKKIANTTLLSSILNIFINLILIKFIGLYAACISTLLSYFIMSIYRYIDCKKYVNLKLNFKQILIYTIVYIFSSYIYLNGNFILYIVNFFIVVLYSFYINRFVINLFCKGFILKIKKLQGSYLSEINDKNNKI